MTNRSRRCVGFVLVAGVLAGCADDGPSAGEPGGWSEYAPPTSDPAVVTTPTDQTATDQTATGEATAPPVATGQVVEPTGVVVQVIALDNSFRPQVVEVAVGDEVAWQNRGMNEHNVLRVEGGGWGVEVEDFQPGAVYSHVFTEPGEYRYYCSIHGSTEVGMVGTVVVTG